MDKNQILDYVMNSPGNTNRAVLSGMLDSITGNEVARFDVNVTMDYQTDHYEVTGWDKTFEEIFEAYNSGKIIVAHTKAFGGSQMLNMYDISESSATFTSCDIIGKNAHILYLAISSSVDSAFYYKVIS